MSADHYLIYSRSAMKNREILEGPKIMKIYCMCHGVQVTVLNLSGRNSLESLIWFVTVKCWKQLK